MRTALIAICVAIVLFFMVTTVDAFGGGSPPKVPPHEPAPQKTDPDLQKQKADAALRARKRKGRAATILSGETAPSDAVEDSRKDLLGA